MWVEIRFVEYAGGLPLPRSVHSNQRRRQWEFCNLLASLA